jgi:tetratricopeptide (TPR) repeat protein
VAAQHSESLRAQLGLITFRLGAVTCKAGNCNEGMPLLERGIELESAQFGVDHHFTQNFVDDLLQLQISLGQYDKAEHTYAKLEASYEATKETSQRSLILLRGVQGAQIALDRNQPKQAEALTRTALTSWQELHGDDRARGTLLAILGSSLVAQKKWNDAATTLGQAIEVLQGSGGDEEFIAAVELDRARAQIGLGKKTAALALAKHARDVLERYPAEVTERRQADRLLASLSGGRSKRAR